MVSPHLPAPLLKLGFKEALEVLFHLPIRYEDETHLYPLEEALHIHDREVQTQGWIIKQDLVYRPRRQLIVTVKAGDSLVALRWFNFYPSQMKQMAVGRHIRFRGLIRTGFMGPEIVHPVVKVLDEDAPLPNTLTPVYSTIAGVSQLSIRKAILQFLKSPDLQKELADTLPPSLIQSYFPHLELPSLLTALNVLHQPAADDDLEAIANKTHPAWRRVQIEELLAQQVSLIRAKKDRQARLAPKIPVKTLANGLLSQFEKTLPFVLTGAQQRVWQEIQEDLSLGYPMNRLLQGDVGSGKTIIAALACLHVIDAGWQTAIMAPTEILAEQHYRKLSVWLNPLGVKIVWLTGSLKASEKNKAYEEIASGQAQLVIGTHALIQDAVQFKKLGFVVVDEQHRFGVKQRLTLQEKLTDELLSCHQLMMSATPIPRTLAMTFYADLEMSVIDELPPGRQAIVTKLMKEDRRDELVASMLKELKEGRQAYWVCPLIEESEAMQLQTATATYEYLQQAAPGLQIGLIHGRLKPSEKQDMMDRFVRGEIQVLVATTVIEVGVDVPKASLMVIENAERFGYAQLHQLRGRIGRGSDASICILLYGQQIGEAAKTRLQTIRETQDGFLIAEKDLELRGPGEILGSRQSGDALLRFVDLQREQGLIAQVQKLAWVMMDQYPEHIQAHLVRWLRHRVDFVKA